MSSHQQQRRLSVTDIAARKGAGSIVSLTAYTCPMATRIDAHADVILIGDSLGMVVYGMPSTLGVTLDMMIAHSTAVMRGSQHACVVADLPFGCYQASLEQAFLSAAQLMAESGVQAVKLEGGSEMAPTVQFLTQRGVPVMAHIGLMPQQVNTMGGFKVQGKDAAAARKILEDALAMEAAGAFAIVLEGIGEALARQITAALRIPTIGIGASPACDGQILVTEDMLGMFDTFVPKFVKRFAQTGEVIDAALAAYAAEVRQGTFPAPEHCFQYGQPSPLEIPAVV
jgi:3-methyl-2-oxobutanoate hydroxymethyltransferase